jgi:hypothetical protein
MTDDKILLLPGSSSVFPDLLKAIPVSVHVNIILFSIILIVLTMVGAAFFMYNAFGKPFESLHGPLGLYLLSFISGKYKILPLNTGVLFSVSMCSVEISYYIYMFINLCIFLYNLYIYNLCIYSHMIITVALNIFAKSGEIL